MMTRVGKGPSEKCLRVDQAEVYQRQCSCYCHKWVIKQGQMSRTYSHSLCEVSSILGGDSMFLALQLQIQL